MPYPSVGIVAYPGISPFIFSIPYTIFTMAPADEPLFKVNALSLNGRALTMEGGLVLSPAGGLKTLEQMDIIVVPGWHDIYERPAPQLNDALVRAHERGAWVVGLCYGAYALAYTGLLDDRKASTHWLAEADFSRRFPNVHLDTNSLYVEDDHLVTSAGIGAGLDCCLFLVREIHGSKIANKVARTLVLPPHREGGQAQFIEQPVAISSQDARINGVISYVMNHIEMPHSLDSLATYAAMSRRTFTRHFQKATGTTVGKWITNQRLRRSCELLESTKLSIEEVSYQSGFETPVAFRKNFKERFRVSPRVWRKTFEDHSSQ